MEASSAGYGWEAYDVTTSTGYELSMFRITTDPSGQDLVDTKGPIVLTSGLYSESIDWLSAPDPLLPNTPVQLAQKGFDVWIGESRGARFSLGHRTINTDTDVGKAAYWDYSYPEIGREDFPAMVDKIIAERPAESCAKVTMVAHSAAANAAMVMASEQNIDAKVDRIVTLAPCLQINGLEWFFPNNDMTSVEMVYGFFEEANINSLFTPAHTTETAGFCEGVYAQLCNAYLRNNNPDRKPNSKKFFEHLHQNSATMRFQEYLMEPGYNAVTESVDYKTPEFDLTDVTVPTFAVYADSEIDNYCPSDYNAPFMNRIIGVTSDWVSGASHTDMILDNSLSLTQLIGDCLPDERSLIIDIDKNICPLLAPPPAPAREKKVKGGSGSSSDSGSDRAPKEGLRTTDIKEKGSSDKSSSDKSGDERAPMTEAFALDGDAVIPRTFSSNKERRLNTKLDKCMEDMEKYAETGKGDPEKIMKMLTSVVKRMDKYGFEHAEMTTM